MSAFPTDLRALLGTADVYLIDQVMRGRIERGMRVLDAGCGRGRNVELLLRIGCEVHASDADASAVEAVRGLASELDPELGPDELERRIRVERVESTSFEPETFDVVVCNAVLHFARDPAHFRAMLDGAWRPLKAGGLLFARLASSIGIEGRVRALGGGRFALPDGTERYLVDEAVLLAETERLGGELADPIKTVNVQGRRCMTTWAVRRGAREGAPSRVE